MSECVCERIMMSCAPAAVADDIQCASTNGGVEIRGDARRRREGRPMRPDRREDVGDDVASVGGGVDETVGEGGESFGVVAVDAFEGGPGVGVAVTTESCDDCGVFARDCGE